VLALQRAYRISDVDGQPYVLLVGRFGAHCTGSDKGRNGIGGVATEE
jgi:hypothetical protein